jgi:transcriptional regulator with XRE-family HTH domain
MVSLRAVRRAAGYTLEDVSLLAALSPAQISRAERGLRRLSPGARVRVARALALPHDLAKNVVELAPPRPKDEATA